MHKQEQTAPLRGDGARWPEGDRLVTLAEAHERLRCSRGHVYELIGRGELPPLLKRGRRSYLLESDVTGHIQRLKAQRGTR